MTKPLPLLDAVFKVLKDVHEGLRVEEITKRVLELGLWHSTGATPAATVGARLAMDTKTRGDTSRFVRSAPATYALRAISPANDEHPTVGHVDALKPTGPMSFTDAAEAVLNAASAQEPLNYRLILQTAIEKGWLVTSGKTPEATLYVSLISEIERATKRGEAPRFSRHPKGFFGLTKWTKSPLESQIQAHNRKVRSQLLARLHSMPPEEFQSLVAQLLIRLGFEDVTVSKYSGDGGIDVRGILVVAGTIRTHMAVQVKRWMHNVQSPTVQQVRGSLGTHDQGLIITTSDFGKGAQNEASRANAVPVALINGSQLVGLLAEHQIGIRRSRHDLLSLTALDVAADSPETADA